MVKMEKIKPRLFELIYCKTCNQMVNHLDNRCLRCGSYNQISQKKEQRDE